jgi:hypothetical protein
MTSSTGERLSNLTGRLALIVVLVVGNATASPDARGFTVIKRATSQPTAVTTGDGWDLFEPYHHAYADVRPQAGGIELTTRSEPGAVVRFQALSASHDLRCGDLVGVAIQGAWLRFDAAKRPLELAAEVPSGTAPLPPDIYQWRIGGCQKSEPLMTGKPFALVNLMSKDALVGCRRVYGPPFCWDDKQLMGLEKKEQEK